MDDRKLTNVHMDKPFCFKAVVPIPASTLRQAQDDASDCHSELVEEWQDPCMTDLRCSRNYSG